MCNRKGETWTLKLHSIQNCSSGSSRVRDIRRSQNYRCSRWYFSLKRESLSSSCSVNKERSSDLSKMTPPGMLMLIPIESPLLPSSIAVACKWGACWPAEELACRAGTQQQHFQHLGSKGSGIHSPGGISCCCSHQATCWGVGWRAQSQGLISR